MEEHVLSLLKTISFSDINVLNGTLFTCKEEYPNFTPCLTCISCKLMIILKFCVSLFNHMTDQEIVSFIFECIGYNVSTDIASAINCILGPLYGKDRTYSISRARPSLSTDIMDLSLKNYTVGRAHLFKTTAAISQWIVTQPHVLKSQFIISLLSGLKLAVLAEVYHGIDNRGKSIQTNKRRSSSHELTSGGYGSTDSPMVSADQSYCKVTGVKDLNSTSINRTNLEANIDFISLLPVHISKYILNLLDEDSLKQCSGISANWKTIVQQVRREDLVNQKIKEQSMLLQEVSTKAIDPRYAKDADVPVPRLKPGSPEVMYADGCEDTHKKKAHRQMSLDNSADDSPIPISREIFNMDIAYKNIKTKNVIMEERNVYCGAYSVLLVTEGIPRQMPPATRTISYNSGDLIAVSGSNKLIQFLDIEGKSTTMAKTKIHGHSGSIKVLRIIKKPGISATDPGSTTGLLCTNDSQVLSGSYDTTIRRWDTETGKCVKIYIGHSLTITALDVASGSFVSGSMDCTCKLWNYEDGNSCLTMRHKHSVTAVAMSMKLIVSGDSSGIVKVWNIENGTLLKNLYSHTMEISSIKVDSFHILSASVDCYMLLWSAMGEFDTCIGCFRHPKPVLCMEMFYMRAITGSVDGRIRIWNLLTRQCIRIMRGNSKSDPILTMVVTDNRIVINTVSNVLVFNFEKVDWIYDGDEGLEHKKPITTIGHGSMSAVDRKYVPCKHSYQRYERARYAGNIDPRLFLSPGPVKPDVPATNQMNESICRQFDDGLVLTRASVWLVTPSLTKSIKFDDKPLEGPIKSSSNEIGIEKSEVLDKTDEEMRLASNSSLGRRISYGFESQDHLKSDVQLQDVKKTLRKHIRSKPVIAAQAMPDFVRTMVLQMRQSSSSGRPLSAFSSTNTGGRRSSGPSEINLRAKSSAEDIKSALNPSIPDQTDSSRELSTAYSAAQRRHPRPAIKENIPIPSIVSSAKYVSNRSVVDNFFVPKDYKQLLTEKKSAFSMRHKIVYSQSESIDRNRSGQKNLLKLNSLNLKTFQESQGDLKQINQIKSNYEKTKTVMEETEKYEKWLRKVTGLPCPSYEKDVVMKRPRSAKM